MSKKPLNKALDACYYIFRRAIEDRDFSWHMVGSESFAKTMEAIAEHEGKTREQIEAEFNEQYAEWDKHLKAKGWATEPREKLLEAKLNAMEAEMDANDEEDDFDDDDSALEDDDEEPGLHDDTKIVINITEYVRQCRYALHKLNLETLDELLDGKALTSIPAVKA